MYPGNTFEGATLTDIVKHMREKFKVRRFISVANRGLFSIKNLKYICAHCGGESGEFIVGMKLGQLRQRHNEFYDRSRFKKLSEELELYETTHNGDRCIVTWSQQRADHDRKTRDDILSKVRKKLIKRGSARDFVSNNNYLKYVSGLKEGSPKIDESAIAAEASRDGFFGIITNVPVERMSTANVTAAYKNLRVVEDSF